MICKVCRKEVGLVEWFKHNDMCANCDAMSVEEREKLHPNILKKGGHSRYLSFSRILAFLVLIISIWEAINAIINGIAIDVAIAILISGLIAFCVLIGIANITENTDYLIKEKK